MQETITLSIEELNRIIDERVQVTLTNSKPVRDNRLMPTEEAVKRIASKGLVVVYDPIDLFKENVL